MATAAATLQVDAPSAVLLTTMGELARLRQEQAHNKVNKKDVRGAWAKATHGTVANFLDTKKI